MIDLIFFAGYLPTIFTIKCIKMDTFFEEHSQQHIFGELDELDFFCNFEGFEEVGGIFGSPAFESEDVDFSWSNQDDYST